MASLPGTDSKNCLKIVRVENASLSELSGIFIEIMENKFIKPGSCVLISSLSFLSRVGVCGRMENLHQHAYLQVAGDPGLSGFPHPLLSHSRFSLRRSACPPFLVLENVHWYKSGPLCGMGSLCRTPP